MEVPNKLANGSEEPNLTNVSTTTESERDGSNDLPYKFIDNYLLQTNSTTTTTSTLQSYSDYILVFKTDIDNKDELNKKTNGGNDTRESEFDNEEFKLKASSALQDILTRLLRAGILVETYKFSQNRLALFITVPIKRIHKEYYSSRINDYLNGMRVSNLDIILNSNKDNKEKAIDEIKITPAVRLRLVHDILTGSVEDGGANIAVLNEPFLDALYPVHDRKFNRRWLKNIISKVNLSVEDLTLIRDHFGEELAFYFAFLDFYFSWLPFPSILGLLFYFISPKPSLIHGILNLGWASIFIEGWSRHQKDLAVRWEVLNAKLVERTRPDFKPNHYEIDPVTNQRVAKVTIWETWSKKLLSIPIIAVLGFILSSLVVLSFVIEICILDFYDGKFKFYFSVLPGLCYFLLVNSFSTVYTKFAHKLNFKENHRTESEHAYHLTQKIFIVNFMVSYLSIFLIAWVYIPYCDEITKFLSNFLPISDDFTPVGLGRLQAQLFFFVITNQIINFANETVVPLLLRYGGRTARDARRTFQNQIHQYASSRVVHSDDDDEDESTSLLDATTNTDRNLHPYSQTKYLRELEKFNNEYIELTYYDTYDDYAEMVIQFGYITLFTVVFQLTPLVCFLNNWVELRSDSVKIVLSNWRPIPKRVESIGAWLGNMMFLVWLSSIVTGLLIYQFTTLTIDLEGHHLVVGIVIAMLWEHIWLLASIFINTISQNLPTFAKLTLQMESYKLKVAYLNQMSSNPTSPTNEVNQLNLSSLNDVDKHTLLVADKMLKDLLEN